MFFCFVFLQVFHYKGEFANVIERAKASEIAQYIVQKKDMGIGSALRNVIELDENSPSGRKAKFWRLLGKHTVCCISIPYANILDFYNILCK